MTEFATREETIMNGDPNDDAKQDPAPTKPAPPQGDPGDEDGQQDPQPATEPSEA